MYKNLFPQSSARDILSFIFYYLCIFFTSINVVVQKSFCSEFCPRHSQFYLQGILFTPSLAQRKQITVDETTHIKRRHISNRYQLINEADISDVDWVIITQAVRPGFKFRFFFLVQSQIAVWSLRRMRHLCMRTAHGTEVVVVKISTDSMISGAMKSYTNEHTVRGRPTRKDIRRFRNGSVCKPYERSIYERTF